MRVERNVRCLATIYKFCIHTTPQIAAPELPKPKLHISYGDEKLKCETLNLLWQ